LDNSPVPSAGKSSKQVLKQITIKQDQEKRERAMARLSAARLPTQNPCAQCGHPISMPDWIESLPGGRTAFLWHCYACDYRFEAVAYFAEEVADQKALAA
jgi:hypothetical protein